MLGWCMHGPMSCNRDDLEEETKGYVGLVLHYRILASKYNWFLQTILSTYSGTFSLLHAFMHGKMDKSG